MTSRPRYCPPIDTGVIASAPAAGPDGRTYANVTLDTNGMTVPAALCATAAHSGSYMVGDPVVIQVFPIGSKISAAVLGVLT